MDDDGRWGKARCEDFLPWMEARVRVPQLSLGRFLRAYVFVHFGIRLLARDAAWFLGGMGASTRRVQGIEADHGRAVVHASDEQRFFRLQGLSGSAGIRLF